MRVGFHVIVHILTKLRQVHLEHFRTTCWQYETAYHNFGFIQGAYRYPAITLQQGIKGGMLEYPELIIVLNHGLNHIGFNLRRLLILGTLRREFDIAALVNLRGLPHDGVYTVGNVHAHHTAAPIRRRRHDTVVIIQRPGALACQFVGIKAQRLV